MIKIKKEDLREFLRCTSFMRESHVIPIYAYVKIEWGPEGCCLMRNTGDSFVIYSINAEFKESGAMVLEKAVMQSCVNKMQGNLLTFKINGVKGSITDGEATMTFQGQKPELFPRTEKPQTEDEQELSDEVLEAIWIAKTHTKQQEVEIWECFVYVSKVLDRSAVYGTDNCVVYLRFFNDPLPELELHARTADVVGKLKNVKYSEFKNFQIFNTTKTTYAFVSPIKFKKDISPAIKLKENATKWFTVSRKDVVDFCDFAVDTVGSLALPDSHIRENNEGSLMFYCENNAFSKTLNKPIKIALENKCESFSFNPKPLLQSLKHIPYDDITFHRDKSVCFITSEEDKDFVGAIRGIVYNTEK